MEMPETMDEDCPVCGEPLGDHTLGEFKRHMDEVRAD